MNGMWRILFPSQRIWFNVNRNERVSAIMTRINTTYPITYYQFKVVCCLENDMVSFPRNSMRDGNVINSPVLLTRFHSFLMSNCGKLLIRLQVKEKENVNAKTSHTSQEQGRKLKRKEHCEGQKDPTRKIPFSISEQNSTRDC